MIPAGGSGKLKAKISLRQGQTNPLSKSIMVYTDAGDARPIRLRLKVQPVAPVTVLPRMYVHLQASTGEPGGESLLLRRSDGKPLEVTSATSVPAERLDLSWRTVGEDGEEAVRGVAPVSGDVRLELRLAEDAPVGRRNGVLRVATNHPDAPTLDIPYVAIVRSRIEPRPAEVGLRAAPPGRAGRQTELRLSSTVGVPFEITRLEVSDPDLIRVEVVGEAARQLHHRLNVVLAKDPESDDPAREIRGWVRIHTSDASLPTVEVPVRVWPDPSRVRRGSTAELRSEGS